MRAFCKDDVCLRLQLARLFNPKAESTDLFTTFTGLSDEALAMRCCSVCALRRSTEPISQGQGAHNPVNVHQSFQESQ